MLIHAKALAMYIPLAKTFVTCDASKIGIRGEISQLQENTENKTVSFFSGLLQKFEKKYSVPELELLTCTWNCERFETVVWGRHFTLKTDHKSLLHFSNGAIGDDVRPLRLARWSVRFLRYNFSVVNKLKKNCG